MAVNSFSNLYHCSVEGSFRGDWCCGAKEGSAESRAGCCNGSQLDFNSNGGFGFYFAPQDAVEPSISTVTEILTITTSAREKRISLTEKWTISAFATNTEKSTMSAVATDIETMTISATTTDTSVLPQATTQAKLNKAIAIGAGIGVPLGVSVLLAMSFLLWTRKHVIANKSRSKGVQCHSKIETLKYAEGYQMESHDNPQELDPWHKGPQELESREVHEAPEFG